MTDPKETVTIVNVVASSAVDQELDLKQLGPDLQGADYDSDRFPGLMYRTQDPKATSLIFRSGKILVTGASSVAAVLTVLENIFSALDDLGIHVPDSPSGTVQNIVSSADLDRSLNLNAIAIGLGLENVEYEPEQFPGLVYRIDEPDVVVLLFGSGKIIVTGAKTTEDAERAIDVVCSRLDDIQHV